MRCTKQFPVSSAGAEYLSDFDALQSGAVSLSQLPGRKNVLWFSGGSFEFLMPDVIPVQI